MKKPVLKFCSHDVNQALVDRLHAHPYWQMEYITGKSSIRLCDRNGECGEVPPGVFVLIPPLTPHRFLRSGNGTESYSLKFIWEAEAPGQEIQRYSVSQVFFAWSAENLIRIFSGSFPVRQRNLFLEYLLMNILHFTMDGEPSDVRETPLFSRLYDLVHARGREVNVSLAAEELKMSVSQLKYRFVCESRNVPERNAGSSVKKYLDTLLLDLIEDYLKYSALSIGEIARATRFPDIYSLSHFYKRMRGRAPTRFSATS